MNSKLVAKIKKTEWQLWQNAHYSRRESLELVGIPSLVKKEELETKVCQIFSKINVNVESRDIQDFHHLRVESRTMVKRTPLKYFP